MFELSCIFRLILLGVSMSPLGLVAAQKGEAQVIRHGPEDFRRGTLGDAGANTYVSSRGLQTIHRRDLNGDGEIDLVFTQDHNADYAPDAMIYWGSAEGPVSLQPELPELRSPYTLLKHAEQALKRVTWLPSLGGGRCQIADLNNDGYLDIVSGNMMHNFRQDMPAYVYWGSAVGFREAERAVLPAYIASGIAVGDFNGDGLADIALSNQGFERGFDKRFGELINHRESFIYWGHPAGFDVSRRSALPTLAASDVASGDFNGDGHLDLAFVNNFHDEQSVYVYWGEGAGGFSEARRQVIVPKAQMAKADRALELNVAYAADVTGDGIADLLVGGTTHVFAFSGAAAGLSAKQVFELAADNARAFVVGDFNRDQKPDVVVANAGIEPAQPKSIIYWGGETGYHVDRSTSLSTRGAMSVQAGDLNRDGFTDLVFGNVNQSQGEPAQIFWGGVDGYSDLRRRDLQAFGAMGVGIADLNRDGDLDVLLLNHLSSSGETGLPTSIYWGNPEHSYGANASSHYFPGGYMMYSIADFDDDGHTDLLLVTEGKPWIWWGGTEGYSKERRTPIPVTDLPGGDGVLGLGVADLDGDGWLDLVLSGRAPKHSGPRAIIAYGGPNRFKTARTETFTLKGGPSTVGSTVVTIADLDQDGRLDLIFPLQDIAEGEIRWGSAKGYAEGRSSFLETNGASHANVADLDSDGKLDLVFTSGLMGRRKPGQTVVGGTGIKGTTRNSYASIYWGGKDWNSPEQSELECYNGLDVTIADLNRDGHLDLAFSSYMSDTTRELPAIVYWGDGTRNYAESRRLFLDAASSSSMDAVDLNRDGWPELIITNHQKNFSHTSGTYIYWGSEKGYSLQQRTEVPSIGAHLDAMVDAGSIRDRRLEWELVSPPVHVPAGSRFQRLRWNAKNVPHTGIKFQIRSASTKEDLAKATWTGTDGEKGSYLLSSNTALSQLPEAHPWLQYRAVLTSQDGANSARLDQVEIFYGPR